MTEYLLYGLAKGETERWTEELLTVRTNQAEIDSVREIAAKDGFHSFRVATYRGEAPDFSKTLNR